jgi:hypothetical protein
MSIRPKGPALNWRPRTDRQRAILADVIDRYRQHEAEDTLPRSGRGIFYDLRPSGFGRGVTYLKRGKDPSKWFDPTMAPNAQQGRYGPMEAGPDAVAEIVVIARRAGMIPEWWVADARAPSPSLPGPGYQTAAEQAASIMEDVADPPRITLDKQTGQLRYIEVWCEAGDLVDRLARIAVDEFDVPVYSGGGFDGLKGKRAAAERIADRATSRPSQLTSILLIGDYDRDGRLIRDVYAEDVGAWVTEQHHLPLAVVEFATIAVTEEQAIEHDLLDDEDKAEADGIPVPVMDAILRDAINERQDPAGREMLRERETEVNERLRRLVRQGMYAELRGRED